MNFILLLLTLNFWVISTNSIRFQIFKDFNKRGLIFDFKVDLDVDEELPCTSVKSYAKGIAGSVSTDTCLIAFEEDKCQGKHVKIAPGMDTLPRLNKAIYSFLQCNKTLGGEKIKADLFSGQSLKGEYLNICGCQDIPTQISSTFTRMNNYGNCIEVFSTDTCSGESKEIPAGKNDESESIGELPYYIQSFKSCGASPACISLTAHIIKFEIDFSTASGNSSQEIELGSRTTFFNNGSAQVTQEYEASRTIRQSFSVKRSSSFSSMERTEVEEGHEETWKFGAGLDLGFVGGSISKSISNSLINAYAFEKTTEVEQEFTYTYEEEKTFSVRQEIKIPACVEYTISSMVALMEKVPVKYTVYSKVIGEASGIPLMAEDIIREVDNMTWVENLDEFTPVFKSDNVILANVGVDTWISGEGTRLKDCGQFKKM